ncbi:site-specific integrase [Nostoc sp.]|uniref:site-specific integrase n=1 Tax=Nostoc sp. TaxID=1180 RepID=UPI002FF81535
MMNSAKTATGKAKKGEVSVRLDSGNVKACFPRPYFPGEPHQVKRGTGISNIEGWEDKARLLKRRLQLEVEEGKLTNPDGTFNENRFREILVEQKLRPSLKVLENPTTSDGQLPPKPELSILEVWDMYCEYRKQGLRESNYESKWQGAYKNFLESAIEATKSQDAIKIRNWLIENRNSKDVKDLLSNLSKGYQSGMKNKLLSHNPFEGMAEEITSKGARRKNQNEVDTEGDDDAFNELKAYTWDEAQAILNFTKTIYPYWFNFLKFKFLTGVRTGEAVGLMWCDIEWNRERVLIRRTYDRETKKFYPLKNDKTYKGEEVRKFPMPKDGELWNLLKSTPQRESNEIVFKPRHGKIINSIGFFNVWKGRKATESTAPTRGIIPSLIEQGKLTQYLPPYNTRHTFITHAVFDLGIDEKIVSKWCGHKVEVSNKHYQDVAIFAERINPEVPQQQSKIDLLEQQLAEQKELINRLMENRDI